MSFSLAQFLAKSKNSKTLALKKFIEIATYNDMTCSVGWNARIEAAKLILLMNEGKATSKVAVFTWLSEMVQYNNGKNLFTAFILLGKYFFFFFYCLIISTSTENFFFFNKLNVMTLKFVLVAIRSWPLSFMKTVFNVNYLITSWKSWLE